MGYAVQVVIGILTGLALIALARSIRRERLLFGASLLIGGVFYVSFGLYDGYALSDMTVQICGGLFFIAAAILGFKYSIVFIGIGWMCHAGWDMFSPMISDVSYIPAWVEPVCLGFDLLVGIYLVARSRSGFELRDERGNLVTA